MPSSAGSELVGGEFIPALVAKTRTDAKGQGRSPLLCAELPRISLGSVSPAIVAAQLRGFSLLFANLLVGNLSPLLRAGFIYPDSGMERWSCVLLVAQDVRNAAMLIGSGQISATE